MRKTGPGKVAALAAGAVLATSCSSPSATVADSAASPHPGGTLRIGLDYTPSCLDPQQAGQGPNLEVVESLTSQDPANGTLVPWLASSWQVNPDSTVFTFRLRRGVTFSDGSKLDASVVKANLDTVAGLGPKASNSGSLLAGLTEVSTPDPDTVTVRFGSPNAQFLQATSTPALGLLSPRTLATDAADRCAGKIVGTGPFVLDSYRPKQDIVLSKRRGYGGGPATRSHTGDAYLDKVEIRIIPEAATRTGSLTSGQLDVATAIAPQDEPLVEADGFTLLDRINPGVVLSLFVNEKKPILADRDVRRALQRAIDRPDVVSAFLSDRYRPATSVLASTTPGHLDLGSELAYQPEQAKELLDRAGWRPGPDGIREKDGQRLRLDVIFGRPQSLELVQQQFRAVGVELNLRQLQISELQSQYLAGNFDFFLLDSTRADPDVLRTLFGRATLTDAEPLRAALTAQASTLDPARREQAVADAQRALVGDAHILPINEQSQVVAVSDQVHGLSFTALSELTCYDVWIS